MPYVEVITKIKEVSKECETVDLEKDLISIYNKDYEGYDIGCAINYLIAKDEYEVYMFLGAGKELAAGNVICKFYKTKEEAETYYNELVKLAELNDLNLILNKAIEMQN